MSSSARHALLLHGLGGSAGTWWAVVDALEAAGWTVTAPELRGHGGAPVPDSGLTHDAYAADALALASPVGGPWSLVVGHSLGGAIAVRAAAQDPAWARRLALLDPVLLLDAADRAAVRADELAGLGATEESIRAAQPRWHPRDVAEKARAAGLADPAAVAATIDENDPWDLREDAARLRMPTLVLGGDPAVYTMLPTRVASGLLRANPRIRYAIVAGAGHSPHRDRPQESIAILREWAESPATA